MPVSWGRKLILGGQKQESPGWPGLSWGCLVEAAGIEPDASLFQSNTENHNDSQNRWLRNPTITENHTKPLPCGHFVDT